MYKAEDLIKIAKRHNNAKRSYLLVNPLQGKHLSVNPSKALQMMKALGDKVSAKYSDTRLVIGFAETATAIGAIVALQISKECIYIHTTREKIQPCIEFLEEHSHAPEQRLYCEKLNEWLENTSTIIFVDDEISTGKTLLNVIKQLKLKYPAFNDKKLVAVSIINRLTDENENALKLEGIECEYLIKIPANDFDVSDIQIKTPQDLPAVYNLPNNLTFIKTNLPLNVRLGVQIGKYINELKDISSNVVSVADSFNADSILVLGTEEYMLSAILSAERFESLGYEVYTQSTTRSPIGINSDTNYPIREGFQLKSFYDENRTTYIYNLNYYDLIIFVSDVDDWNDAVIKKLITVFNVHGYREMIFFGG